jgi:WD40 repeat protein
MYRYFITLTKENDMKRTTIALLPLALSLLSVNQVKTMEAAEPAASKATIPLPAGNLQERASDFVLAVRSFGGDKTATLDRDGRIQVWDTNTGALLKTLGESYKDLGGLGLAFTPAGTALIIETPTMTTKVVIASLEELKKESEAQALFKRPQLTKESPGAGALQEKSGIVLRGIDASGHKTATLDQEGVIQIWDTESGVLLKTLREFYKRDRVRHLDFNVAGTVLIIETPTGTIKVSAE